MKRTRIYTIVSAVIIVLVFSTVLTGTSRRKNIETKIKSGIYIPEDLINKRSLMNLPIPASNENYAFLQSKGKVTNIVIGNFAEGQQMLTWIQDQDANGSVDQIVYYYPEQNKYRSASNPSETISDEKLKEMKHAILDGDQSELSPNREGVPPLKSLIEKSSDKITVIKSKNGYRVNIPDADNNTQIRISFIYSNNHSYGYDLIFDVAYYNVRETHVAPVIKNSVYCKNSEDPVIKEVTQELLDHTAKYYPYK